MKHISLPLPNSLGGKLKFNNFLRTCSACDPAWDCTAVAGYVVKYVKRLKLDFQGMIHSGLYHQHLWTHILLWFPFAVIAVLFKFNWPHINCSFPQLPARLNYRRDNYLYVRAIAIKIRELDCWNRWVSSVWKSLLSKNTSWILQQYFDLRHTFEFKADKQHTCQTRMRVTYCLRRR